MGGQANPTTAGIGINSGNNSRQTVFPSNTPRRLSTVRLWKYCELREIYDIEPSPRVISEYPGYWTEIRCSVPSFSLAADISEIPSTSDQQPLTIPIQLWSRPVLLLLCRTGARSRSPPLGERLEGAVLGEEGVVVIEVLLHGGNSPERR